MKQIKVLKGIMHNVFRVCIIVNVHIYFCVIRFKGAKIGG